MPSVVTITTDFEEREPYVASAKGVLLARCPGVQIIDLGHQISRGGLLEAALFIAEAVPYFPAGTVHLVAVASGATPIAVSWSGQYLVAPDNGVLTLLSEQRDIDEVRAITNPDLNLSLGGQTYFAREVFAPAAALLAQRAAFNEMGEPIPGIKRLDIPRARKTADRTFQGQIIHVNRFGSLVTNIHRGLLDGLRVNRVTAADFPVGPLSGAYSDVPSGKPLALFGSGGYLEIAYNGDRADQRLNLRPGIIVTLDVEPAA